MGTDLVPDAPGVTQPPGSVAEERRGESSSGWSLASPPFPGTSSLGLSRKVEHMPRRNINAGPRLVLGLDTASLRQELRWLGQAAQQETPLRDGNEVSTAPRSGRSDGRAASAQYDGSR